MSTPLPPELDDISREIQTLRDDGITELAHLRYEWEEQSTEFREQNAGLRERVEEYARQQEPQQPPKVDFRPAAARPRREPDHDDDEFFDGFTVAKDRSLD